MEKPEHLKGPWEVVTTRHGYRVVKILGNGDFDIRVSIYTLQASIEVEEKTRKDILRLIAAAPELLDALEELLESWRIEKADQYGPYFDSQVGALYKQYLNVIKKAKGE